jgi:hypothetical protein
LIVYDTFQAGQDAVSTYQRLRQNLEGEYDFSVQLWRTDLLGLAASDHAAMRRASESDMVVVALNDLQRGVDRLRTWFEQWPVLPENPRRVLVALVTGPRQELDQNGDRAGLGYLRALADRLGMDLITSEAPHREEASNEPDQDRAVRGKVPAHSGPSRSSRPFEISRRTTASPRWGIND